METSYSYLAFISFRLTYIIFRHSCILVEVPDTFLRELAPALDHQHFRLAVFSHQTVLQLYGDKTRADGTWLLNSSLNLGPKLCLKCKRGTNFHHTVLIGLGRACTELPKPFKLAFLGAGQDHTTDPMYKEGPLTFSTGKPEATGRALGTTRRLLAVRTSPPSRSSPTAFCTPPERAGTEAYQGLTPTSRGGIKILTCTDKKDLLPILSPELASQALDEHNPCPRLCELTDSQAHTVDTPPTPTLQDQILNRTEGQVKFQIILMWGIILSKSKKQS